MLKKIGLYFVLFLLAAPLVAHCATTTERMVYYNADGGSYYHLDHNCSSTQSKLSSAPYADLLFPLCSLLPCEECAPAETRNHWFGEAEYREAWSVLQKELTQLGQRPYAPCGWVITPSKEQISVYVIFIDGKLGICDMDQNKGTWTLKNFKQLPALSLP